MSKPEPSGTNAVFNDYVDTLTLLTKYAVGRPTLKDRVQAVLDEVERLQAIVDRYPKTRDGVSIAPGMDVFRCDGKLRARAMMHYEPWSNHCWEDCVCGPAARSSYSTKEAAEAARGEA